MISYLISNCLIFKDGILNLGSLRLPKLRVLGVGAALIQRCVCVCVCAAVGMMEKRTTVCV